MCNQSYNGYTNYETWNVQLWIDNDESEQNFVSGYADEIYQDCEQNEEEFVNTFEDWLKDHIEENNPLASECSTYSDLLQAALDAVNWRELAHYWLEVAQENNPALPDDETEE